MKGPGSLGTLFSLREMHLEEDIDVVKELFTDKEYEQGLKEMDNLLKDIGETRKNINSRKYDLNILTNEKTFNIQQKKDIVRKHVESLSETKIKTDHKINNEELLDQVKENEYKEILKKIERQDSLIKSKIKVDNDSELKDILNSKYCQSTELDEGKMEQNIDNLVSSIDECLKFGEEIDEYINKMLIENEKNDHSV